MGKESQVYSLDDLNIVKFLKAIDKSDHKIVNCTKSNFEDLVLDYMNFDKPRSTNLEKREKHYKDKIFIVKSCLFVLSIKIADRDLMEVLRDQGYHIKLHTYFQDITKIAEDVEFDQMKLEEVQNAMPKKPTKKSKDVKKINIFDILTTVSTGLELSLDFNKMVVSEFLSYRSALQRKILKLDEQAKKIKK